MKTTVAFLILAMLTAVSARPWTSVENLEGIWRNELILPFLLVLTEQGVASACTSNLTQECRDELPNGIETVSIVNNSFALNFTQFVGINTIEAATEAYLACAASGVFPFETITPLPLAPIQAYNPIRRELFFIDDRRPNDLNCVFAKLRKYGRETRLELEYVISSEGPLDEVVRLGPSFRCERPVGLCEIEQTPERVFNRIYVKFTVPCAEGACLDNIPTTRGSKFRFFSTEKFHG